MRPEETIRRLQAGQFWGRLNPLTLMRVDLVGEVAGGDPGVYEFTMWTPEGEQSGCTFISVEQKDFRYLWFDQVHRLHVRLPEGDRRGFAEDLDARPGDVWLIQAEHDSPERRLIFIGPKTEGKEIHVLADWEVPFEYKDGGRGKATNILSFAHLYQPGPGRRQVGQRSVYEHLRKPSV